LRPLRGSIVAKINWHASLNFPFPTAVNSVKTAGLENPAIFRLKKASKFGGFAGFCVALEIFNFLMLLVSCFSAGT